MFLNVFYLTIFIIHHVFVDAQSPEIIKVGSATTHAEKPDPEKIYNVQEKTAMLFPKGIVPYFIDPKSYDSMITNRLKAAMSVIQESCCVVFHQLKNRPINNDSTSWVHFTNPINKRSCIHEPVLGGDGEITITIGYDCMRSSDLLHSVLHAIGFKDEVSHPHRDQYIRIVWDNIQPEYRKLFRIQLEDAPYKVVEYDPTSIMHFHSRAYSSNGGPTIIPKTSGLIIAPSDNLSQLDVMKLRLWFGHECNKRKLGDLIENCKNVFHNSRLAGPADDTQDNGSVFADDDDYIDDGDNRDGEKGEDDGRYGGNGPDDNGGNPAEYNGQNGGNLDVGVNIGDGGDNEPDELDNPDDYEQGKEDDELNDGINIGEGENNEPGDLANSANYEQGSGDDELINGANVGEVQQDGEENGPNDAEDGADLGQDARDNYIGLNNVENVAGAGDNALNIDDAANFGDVGSNGEIIGRNDQQLGGPKMLLSLEKRPRHEAGGDNAPNIGDAADFVGGGSNGEIIGRNDQQLGGPKILLSLEKRPRNVAGGDNAPNIGDAADLVDGGSNGEIIGRNDQQLGGPKILLSLEKRPRNVAGGDNAPNVGDAADFVGGGSNGEIIGRNDQQLGGPKILLSLEKRPKVVKTQKASRFSGESVFDDYGHEVKTVTTEEDGKDAGSGVGNVDYGLVNKNEIEPGAFQKSKVPKRRGKDLWH